VSRAEELASIYESGSAPADRELSVDLAAALPRVDLRGIDRASELLTTVTLRALANAGVRLKGTARERTGLIAGNLRASPDSLERFHSSIVQRGLAKPDATAFAQLLPSAAQSACAKALNIRGAQSTITIGEGSGLMAFAIAAWMLARRRDSDRMVAATLDVRTEGGALRDAACGFVLDTAPSSVEVAGIGIAGPEQLEEAIAQAQRRWGSMKPPDLVMAPTHGIDVEQESQNDPFAGMPSTSSSFALAHALDSVRRRQVKTALVACRGVTASVAVIVASTEVTHAA
jgi:hypothetical protein